MQTKSSELLPWLTGATVLLALFAGVVLDIDLPGVYMDAVNPDYLVVSVLNPGRQLALWALPGNLLAGRFPVLTSLYHGTEQLWFGLPFFALFGTTVVALRLIHGLFAAAVLVCVTLLLRRAGLREVAIAAVGIALAVDPSFVFAFRTQSYITLAPCAWLLASLLALLRLHSASDPRRWLLASGIAFGIAFFGYFVYLFYLPAVVYVVLAAPAAPREPLTPRWRRLWPWAIGVCIGAIGYPLGYALALGRLGGPTGFVAYLAETQRSLGVMNSTLGLGARLDFAWAMVTSITRNWWHHSMMFGGDPTSVPWAQAKTMLLTVAPIGLWLLAEARRNATLPLRATVACGVSFFALSLVFGNRLGGHHYTSLLVLGYVGLALGIAALVGAREGRPSQSRTAWIMLPMAVLVALNLQGQIDVRTKLRETGGMGLLSDAINRFAADAAREHADDFYFFPDWGLALPFAFLTAGGVDFSNAPDANKARTLLCKGRDIHVALITGDRRARIEAYTREFDWSDPTVTPYRQRDGATVFDIATWRGETPGGAGERCRVR